MSDLVGNPEDRFSHDEAQIIRDKDICAQSYQPILITVHEETNVNGKLAAIKLRAERSFSVIRMDHIVFLKFSSFTEYIGDKVLVAYESVLKPKTNVKYENYEAPKYQNEESCCLHVQAIHKNGFIIYHLIKTNITYIVC